MQMFFLRTKGFKQKPQNHYDEINLTNENYSNLKTCLLS